MTRDPGPSNPVNRALGLSAGVLALKPSALLRAMLKQPISVWSLFAYLFFEYVRPQTIYPALNVLPFARLSLICALGACVLEANGKRRWNLIDVALVVFTAVLLASLITAFDRDYGVENLNLYFSWIVVYVVLSTTVNSQTRVVLMLIGWFLWNFKMSFFAFRSWAAIGFRFRDWGVSGAPGWFENSGEFGIQMCVILPISLFFAMGVRRYVGKLTFAALLLLPVTAVAGAVASSSRGALLGMGGIAFWMLARSKYKVRGLISLTAFLLLVFAIVPQEQRERLYASGDDRTSISRLTYWTRGIEFANESPVFGIGYKGWYPYYSYVWGSRLEPVQLPHNLFIECLAELGYTGFFALLFLIGSTFWLNMKTRRAARRLGDQGSLAEHLGWGFDGALVGYLITGFFVTVLYYPYLWINLGMTAGLHLSVRRALSSTRLHANGRADVSSRAVAGAESLRLNGGNVVQ